MTHHDARAEMKRPERHNGHHPENGQRPVSDGPNQGHEAQSMVQMAEQITRHYDEPAPHSQPPTPDPFPPAVMRGLGLGAALGAAIGAIFGYALTNNLLVILGWELMYSGAPATIIALWLFLGAALGIATVGVGTVLTAPLTSPWEQPANEQREPEAPAERARIVGDHQTES